MAPRAVERRSGQRGRGTRWRARAELNAIPEHQALRHRRSVRLRAYDYASAGAYFVTIVSNDRACLFGDVVADTGVPSDIGRIVEEAWCETAAVRTRVQIDEFVVMPNHLHGVLWIIDEDARTEQDTPPRAPIERRFGRSQPNALSTIVNNVKGRVTTRARGLAQSADLVVWQRGFHERIIRNDPELHKVREYIIANPRLWTEDEEYRRP